MKSENTQEYKYKSEIDQSDSLEMKYWATRWNVPSQLLVGAIRATGTNKVIAIEEYIDERRRRVKRPRYISQL